MRIKMSFFVLILFGFIQTVWSQDTGYDGLVELANARNLPFGTAFYYRNGWDVAEYETHFLANFNSLTPEGGFIFQEVSPSEGEILFSGGDKIVNFAHANQIDVRVQHLAWHRHVEGYDYLLPKWLLDGNYTKSEMAFYLKDFISRTITHYNENYPNTVKWWSVVNEAGSNNAKTFESSFWYDNLGESFVDSSFHWARENAPDAKLYYNDYYYHGAAYGGNRIPHKIDFTYDVVSGLLARGVPIDGV